MLGQLLGAIGGIAQGIQGISDADAGAQLAIQGGQLQAQSYRVAGASAMAAATYNSQVIGVNLIASLDLFGRQIRQNTSSQRTQAAYSGLSVSSGSFMSVMNGSLDVFSRQVTSARTAAQQKQTSILFEGASQQVAYENQARIAEYNGQVEAWKGQRQAASAGADAALGAIGAIGGLFF